MLPQLGRLQLFRNGRIKPKKDKTYPEKRSPLKRLNIKFSQNQSR